MNALFWIIVTGLLLLALLILARPLLKRHASLAGDHKQRNIDIARQRLADLQQQLAAEVLTQAQFDEQYAELQLMLRDDLQDTPAGDTPEKAGGRWVFPLLALAIPGFSVLLYLLLGDPQAVSKAELQATQSKAAANIGEMVGKLEQRLQQNPDDNEGWLMLGRSYSYLQQHQKAADVFARLNRQQPDNIEIALQYANSLAMARGGRLQGEPVQLVSQVLQRQPDNTNALWLAGMAKVEEGDYPAAQAHWQKLAALLPADSEQAAQVRQMLAALEQEMAQADNPAPAAGSEIQVQVAVAPALQNRLPADATLFVYAQAVNGPKMPLAILRKQVADLPLNVVLNDQMAMQPGTRLGDQPQIRIVARVSKSGQAVPETGDLIGTVELAAPYDNQVANVLINQEVK